MTLNGIWTTEVYSVYGWETISVLVLQDGLVHGGSSNHHARGTYTLADDKVTIKIHSHLFLPGKLFFRNKKGDVDVIYEGTLNDETIEGYVTHSVDEHSFMFRLTRRAGMLSS